MNPILRAAAFAAAALLPASQTGAQPSPPAGLASPPATPTTPATATTAAAQQAALDACLARLRTDAIARGVPRTAAERHLAGL